MLVTVDVIVLDTLALDDEVAETDAVTSLVRLNDGDVDGLPVDDGVALDERLANGEEDGTVVSVISTLPVFGTLIVRTPVPLTLAVDVAVRIGDAVFDIVSK